jgi:hypothetical protein
MKKILESTSRISDYCHFVSTLSETSTGHTFSAGRSAGTSFSRSRTLRVARGLPSAITTRDHRGPGATRRTWIGHAIVVVVSGATVVVGISGCAPRGLSTFSTNSAVGAVRRGARSAGRLGITRALATMTGVAVQDRRSNHCSCSKDRGVNTKNNKHTRKNRF